MFLSSVWALVGPMLFAISWLLEHTAGDATHPTSTGSASRLR
jgi:hypothetical protein